MRVCKECCLLGTEGQTERKKMLYAHLWIRSDSSKITDSWEVVDDGKIHKCSSCKKVKEVKEFNLSGDEYNSRLTKSCSICLEVKKEK